MEVSLNCVADTWQEEELQRDGKESQRARKGLWALAAPKRKRKMKEKQKDQVTPFLSPDKKLKVAL